MRRLGYTRYVAQGGDVGSQVTDAMGRLGLEGMVVSIPTCSHRRWANRALSGRHPPEKNRPRSTNWQRSA